MVMKKGFLFIILALSFLGYYSYLIFSNVSDVAGGSDSSGYLNCAKRLWNGHLVERIPALDLFFLKNEFNHNFRPLGFSWSARRMDIIIPSYPVGLPLHMAFFAAILGWDKGPFLVSPAAALLGLLLIYWLGRQLGLSPLYSGAGAFILAVFPPYVFQAIQPMSDVLATLWVMIAILAAVLSQKRSLWALLSGAAFGMSVLVRPSDILAILAILFMLPTKRRSYLYFVAGGLPFGLFFLILNHALYGGWFITGYHGGIFWDLALKHFPVRFWHYLSTLSLTLTPLILLGWGIFLAIRSVSLKKRLFFFVWFFPLFSFFCFYKPYEAWWYLRFLLPVIPALILAFLLTVHHFFESLAKKKPRERTIRLIAHLAFSVIVMGILYGEARQVKKLNFLSFGKGESTYRESCLWAKKELPEKSVVICHQLSGALTYYTSFIPCRLDSLDFRKFEYLRPRVESQGYAWYALLFGFEEENFQKKAMGDWVKIGQIKEVGIWKLASKVS
jgi:hypothetical protein